MGPKMNRNFKEFPGDVGDVVQSLIQEDSTCHGAAKPVHHDY